MSAVLSIRGLHVSYGAVPAVRDVNLDLHAGELRVILGANGAGKSTILKTILGLMAADSGEISICGSNAARLTPQDIHALGVSWVPEARQLWGNLSVYDNLLLGGFGVSVKRLRQQRIEAMLEKFPRLRERQSQLASSLSGGEQQMVAVSRALISSPKILLMDEPSLGLAPLVVKQIFDLIKEVNSQGVSVLLVEQNARQALKVASWGYLLETGQIVAEGSAEELSKSEKVQEVFLGGST
jgi:branched-chain amino acid transport system ATP-binding protein